MGKYLNEYNRLIEQKISMEKLHSRLLNQYGHIMSNEARALNEANWSMSEQMYNRDIEIAGGMTVSRIEISPLLQSLFSEWTDTRTVYAHVSLRSKKASLLSFHTYVVYGSADNGLTRFLLAAKKKNILVTKFQLKN